MAPIMISLFKLILLYVGCEVMATLDELITEAGLRKTELATESGINAATISRISHGDATTRVTVVKLVRILEKYLNRTIDIDNIEGLNITR
jgi:transcriptional regulator with XRE-family HTH domain